MARKIKFALEMKGGEQVRDIEALREHFDLGKTVGYFQNGMLLTWLRDRYYDEEAEAVEALSKDDDDFKRKLCAALGAEYEETEEIDTEEIVRRNERIALLKQHTADEAILQQVDCVAFDQEELGNLLDEGAETIYLCHGSFTIPCREKNKKYIGVGLVEVVIPSKIRLDFTKLGIEFQNVKFDSKYQAMCHHEESSKRQSQMLQQGKKAASTGNCKEAVKLFKEVAEAGNVEAMLELGLMYCEGKGGAVDYSEGSKWFKLVKETYETEKDEAGASKATGKGKYDWQEIVEQSKQAIEDKLFALSRLGFEQAAQAGNVRAMLELGAIYLEGKGVEKDYKECAKWFKLVKQTMGKDVGTKVCTIESPMPGKVLSVNVKVGDVVKSGDVLLILEAMKMQNEIVAPCDGIISEVNMSSGCLVNTGDVMIVILKACTIESPMPGKVLSVNVKVGDVVKSGDVLLILEAMKMQNEIMALCDGIISEVNISSDCLVNTGDVMIVIL